VLAAQLRDLPAQLGERHLAVALREQQLVLVREELVDGQRPAHRGADVHPVVLARVRGVEDVLAPGAELDAHDPALAVDDELAGVGEDELRLLRVAGVVDEEVLPETGLRLDVLHVEHHPAGEEVVRERAGLHVRARLAHQQREHELAVRLVGRGEGDRVDVEGDRRHHRGQHHDGGEQAHRAQPHGAHGDDLAVAGQPAEREEHAQEEGHGDGDGQDRGQKVQEDAQDRAEVGAAGHEDGEQARDLVDQEDEREDEEPDRARGQHLPDDVAVDETRPRRREAPQHGHRRAS
jgi:hypothetical protein